MNIWLGKLSKFEEKKSKFSFRRTLNTYCLEGNDTLEKYFAGLHIFYFINFPTKMMTDTYYRYEPYDSATHKVHHQVCVLDRGNPKICRYD